MLANLFSDLENFEYLIHSPFALLVFAFCVWMFVDAVRRKEWIWAFFIFIGFGIAAAFYYFVVYRNTPSAMRGFELPGAQNRRRIKELQAQIHHLDKAHHHSQLGDVYFSQGKLEKAEASYRAAMERDAEDIDTRAHLGQCLLRQKRAAEARPLLEGVVQQDPKHDYSHSMMALAETLGALGETDKALPLWQQVTESHSYPRARVQLAELLIARNELEPAQAALREVIEDDPHTPAFQRKRDRVWVRKAKSLLRKVSCFAVVLCFIGAPLRHLFAETTVISWGTGFSNAPSSLTNAVAISAGGFHDLALCTDGTVVSWGAQTNVPTGLSNVVAIAAGGKDNLALRQDGTPVAWGSGTFGIMNVPASATNIVAISVGSSHCLALRHDGNVLAWGATNYTQTSIPASATNVVTLSAGGAHSAVLRRDGAVVCWGRNAYGQVTNIPANLTNVLAVSAGGEHTLALHRDGTHSYWGVVVNFPGTTYSNAPTGFTNVTYVSSGSLHSTSLLSDGTVHTDGYPPTTIQPPGLSNVVAVSAGLGSPVFSFSSLLFQGGTHSLALVGDGAIHAPTSPRLHRLNAGSFLILNPLATGPQPLHYQWRLNDAELPGGSVQNFVIPKASRRDAGDYSVIISNASEIVTSQVAQVSVQVPQRLEVVGFNTSGQFVLLSGDADGTPLIETDLPAFTLESSGDCHTWEPTGLMPILTNGVMSFTDSEAVGGTNRFYRVQEN